MELVIFFLNVWSIVYPIYLITLIYFYFSNWPKADDFKLEFKINLKTCFIIVLYITSIYSWTI